MNRKPTLVLILSLLVALPAAAGRIPIDRAVPADSDVEIDVEMIAGTIDVVTWDRNEVRVTGSINEDKEELDISGKGDRISIEVEIDDGRWHGSDRGAELEIQVPVGASIDIEVVSGDITIDGVRGPVSVETVSGEIDVRGAMEEIEVACISGRVKVVGEGTMKEGSFETVSGSIDFRGTLHPRGRFSFEAVSGNVTLRLPSDTSAKFDVSTFSGSIDNELGPRARKTSEYLPSKSLNFTMGSGEARVDAEVFSGSIRILKD